MTTFEKLTGPQKIRAALHRDVRAISLETCHFLGLEVTKPAMEVIAELIYKKLSVYGTDLEAFAKHAKRATINSDDVKLLVRRNPSLLARLNSITPSTASSASKRRKTGVKETPAKNKEDTSKNKEDTNKNKDDASNKTTEPQSVADKDKEVDEEVSRILEDKEFVENMIVDEIDLTFD